MSTKPISHFEHDNDVNAERMNLLVDEIRRLSKSDVVQVTKIIQTGSSSGSSVTGMTGLKDNAGSAISNISGYVQVTDDGIVNADKSGNTLALSVVESGIDHGSIGGLTDDDHTQYILVDGTRAFTGNVGMGVNPSSGNHLDIQDTSLNTTDSFKGLRVWITKTAGITDEDDHFIGIYDQLRIQDSSETHGNIWGLFVDTYLIFGNIGTVENNRNLVGIRINTGEVSGTINGNIYGLHIVSAASSGVTGVHYGMYIQSNASFDYAAYIDGKVYIGGNSLINSSVKLNFRDTAIGIYSQADTYLDLYADGAVRIGDSSAGAPTNYSEFESDGTLKFNGNATVWNDLQFPIDTGRVPAANAPNYETFTTNTNAFAFDVDDYIDLQANEYDHSFVEDGTGNFHVHFALKTAQSTGADRYVKFSIWVAYADTGDVWTESTLSAEKTIPNGSSALEAFYLDLGDIDFTGFNIGTQIKCRIKRIAATGGTEYADDVYITQVGSHFEQDTIGSRTEAAK